MQIVAIKGKVWNDDELKEKSIFLDGSYKGVLFDNKRKIYSFDHHSGCVRHVTRSTTRQVYDALMMGFNPKGYTVYINDVDADTAASVMLLMHGADALNKQVIDVIDIVDCFGPTYPLKGKDILIADAIYNQAMDFVKQNSDADIMAQLNKSIQGLRQMKIPKEQKQIRKKKYVNLIESDKIIAVETKDNVFMELYKTHDIVICMTPNTKGYVRATVGKKSEFIDCDFESVIDRLNQIEVGWGGGSAIFGSPRPDGTMLTAECIFDIIKETKGN